MVDGLVLPLATTLFPFAGIIVVPLALLYVFRATLPPNDREAFDGCLTVIASVAGLGLVYWFFREWGAQVTITWGLVIAGVTATVLVVVAITRALRRRKQRKRLEELRQVLEAVLRSRAE